MERREFLIIIIFLLLISDGCARSVAKRRGVYHIVKRHQTLWRICKTYKVDMKEVVRINHIKDPSFIKVGQRIFIPGAKKPLHVDIYIEDIAREKKRKIPSPNAPISFIWPVNGTISRGFGIFKGGIKHTGIDIRAPRGSPIRAAERGVVIYSGNSVRGYGNMIIIKHPHGYTTVYAHNQRNLVNEEMIVRKGEVIAQVGRTGNASGYHLHFEIRYKTKPINPLNFLKGKRS
ncbi:MAG: peptidoglycan DD-metalloendopeptidase family protein [Deltaproteobacteria bacterium]|nr:peptidoglycan DD-metalloendopeptidase family protein [Deltaproteobacteria bacterium]